MVMLVSLAQASEHLRRPEDQGDDGDLELKIRTASGIVIKYLDEKADFLDTDGDVSINNAGDPEGVPEIVQWAVLVLVGCLYSDRERWELLSRGLLTAVKSPLNLYGRTPPPA